MLRNFEGETILTPEMEALLLAKTQIHPDLVPCPKYEEALHHSRPAEISHTSPLQITILNEGNERQAPREEPQSDPFVRISLHV